MQQRIEALLDRWLLVLVRVLNLIIFLAVVLYIGEWVLGIDISKVIMAASIFWAAVRGFEIDFITWTARKIMGLGWGLSVALLSSFILFLWNIRGEYISHLKQLSCNICARK